MDGWLKISLLLSLFGFFKEFQPSESFVYEYLTGNWTDITANEVNEDIFPIAIYANTPFILIVLLVSDSLKYKPLLIACGIFGIIVWSLLSFWPTLIVMQIMEIFYAAFISCDVPYFSYIYANVGKEHFKKATSNTRIGFLLGRSISGITSHVLVHYNVMDIKELNYLSLIAMLIATITSLFFPTPLDENKMSKSQSSSEMFNNLKQSFSKVNVIKWSTINVLSTSGFCLVENYIQTLWKDINVKNREQILGNGVVISVYCIFGAFSSFFAGYLKTNWSENSTSLFITYFFTSGLIIVLTSQTNSIYVSYIGYVILGSFYQFITTVSYSETSRRIRKGSYGLIFGLNTFVSLIIQSLMVFIIIKKFHTPIKEQFLIFGLWHLIVLAIYLIYKLLKNVLSRREKLYDTVII